MKLYNITNWDKQITTSEDLLREKYFFLNKWFDKYKWLYTLNSWTVKSLVYFLSKEIWVILDENFMRKLPNIWFETRQIIKNSDKQLLEILDSPDFLLSFIYLLLWFSITNKKWYSFNSQNSINNLAWTIKQVLESDNLESHTFFCAHRENKIIQPNSLVKQINEKDFLRVKNLLHWFFDNLPHIENYKLNFYWIEWTLDWSLNVFPNILFEHIKNWELYKIPENLDKQFIHMWKLVDNEKEFFSSTNFIDKKVKENYEKYSYEEWQILEALKEVEKHFQRFKKEIEKFANLNIENLKKENIDNSPEKYKEIVEKIFDWILDFDIEKKSKKELAFYIEWWKMLKEKWNIWLWFDRDHEKYQSIWLESWYWEKKFPVLYSRRTWKKSWPEINNLSFRQFWHYYE